MSTLRKWTEDEKKVVISKIEENPNNLQRAFREASLEISCRFLIHKHPDLDKDYLKHLRK